MKRWLPFALVFLTLPFAAGAQSGRNREFDALMRQAGAAYEAHDSAGAIQALERAYALRPVPRLIFNLGRAHDQAGNYATAVEYYRRFLATGPDREAGAIAQEALGIAERNATQQAETQRQRQAAEEAERARALEEARLRTITAEQQRAEEERRRRMAGGPRRITLPVAVAGGVTGAALVAGGVLGALALSAQSSFSDNRGGDARYDASSQGRAMAIGADVAFGTAVIAGAVGLVLFFTQSAPTEAAP